MIAVGKTYRGLRVQLDGGSFRDCTFEDCRLHFSGAFGVELTNCKFKNGCSWHVDGHAKETLDFLRTLYREGGPRIVETTFDTVRGQSNRTGAELQ